MPTRRRDARGGPGLDDIRARINSSRQNNNNNNNNDQGTGHSNRSHRRNNSNRSNKKKSKDKLISATNIKHNLSALHSM